MSAAPPTAPSTMPSKLSSEERLVTRCKTCRMRRKVDKSSSRCSRCQSATKLVPTGEQYSVPRQLNQRVVERRQLLHTFLESYFPPNTSPDTEPEVWLARHMSPLLVLPELDTSSLIMASAVDTLCLAHLGKVYDNQGMILASQDAYGRVLHSIMQAVGEKCRQSYTPREVVASCLLMSVYNDGIPKHLKTRNYSTHLFGAIQYAKAIGPSCLDPAQNFDQKLLMWIRFQSLFVCAARRVEFFWSQPEWRALENRFSSGGSRDWFPLLVPLPGMLEISDDLLRRRPKEPALDEKLSEICLRLDDFRERLFDWVSNDFAGRPGIAALTDDRDFDMEIEEHFFMSTSTTFTTFHVFVDTAHAMRCAVSWLLCLVSDCTLLRLLFTYPHAESVIGRTARDVERKAFISATEICRSVHYYSGLNSLAYAHLLCVWVDLAQTFFEENGAVKEVGWCQACLISTKLRINRITPTCRGTLCRIGDLFGAFTKACRYRTTPLPTPKELQII